MQDALALKSVLQSVLLAFAKASCIQPALFSKTLFQDAFASARRFRETVMSVFLQKRLACFWQFSAVSFSMQDAFQSKREIREQHMRTRTCAHEGKNSSSDARKRLAFTGGIA